MDFYGRKIAMFRTHIDPMIPPKSRQAFTLGEGQDQLAGVAILTSIGVYVKLSTKKYIEQGLDEHIIPFANLQSIRLEPIKPSDEPAKRMGRPPRVSEAV